MAGGYSSVFAAATISLLFHPELGKEPHPEEAADAAVSKGG
jgi:hypothetical protein